MIKSRISKPECLVGTVILIALTSVATPNIFSAFAKARKARTISNAKIIGISFLEFENQYGSLPSSKTKKLLAEEGIDQPTGDTANHYLGQLLASKILDAEQVFHVEGLARTKKCDGIFNTADTTLARGENGFGYVMKAGGEVFGTADRAQIPVVVAPLLKGGKLPTFHGRLFHGEGVDCSVGAYIIDKEGILLSKDTEKNLFLTGEGTIWGEQAPEVKAPWLLEEQKKEAK
ncbi:hypothetical protein N9A94_09210 [Akkermansiaceae bacterium]|nr:hypothetical protein [Akkermansiaceae bacterium]